MAALNKIIHERARLLILTYLASNATSQISFTELQQKLEFTPGNLSIQLKKLKAAKYLSIHKTFKDNKPYTTIAMTPKGSKALKAYIEEMEGIIKTLSR